MGGACSEYLQSAWVVDDLQSAMRQWLQTARTGPFLTFEVHAPESLYRGGPEPLSMTVALAQAGPMQIELIEQTSPGPSAYRDTVPAGSSGFHHIMRLCADYDSELAELRARGVALATEGRIGADIRWVYADTRQELGCMLELCPDTPFMRKLCDDVAAAAHNWDGRDPIRNYGFNL